LDNREKWTLADLQSISRIIDATTKSVEEAVKKMPSVDESIQDLENSLKKSKTFG
jgi:hypothetical protein